MITDETRLAIRIALRRAACAQGLTQAALAERAGLHVRTVRRLLQGETCDLATVEAIARVLRVDIRLVVS
jgi:transcriptional regulator with XRE-family HTH domain